MSYLVDPVPPGDGGGDVRLAVGPAAALAAAGGRRWCTCAVVLAVVPAGDPAPARRGLGGWLLLDALGKLVLGFLSVLLLPLLALRAGLSGAALGPAQPRLLRQPVRDAGDDDAGGAVAPPGADVGGDGGDHAGQRAAASTSTTTPARWRRPGSTC